MAGILQLTKQVNPLAQTFRVTEPGGSVITSVGLFFEKAPKTTDLQLPVTVELRPVVNGQPSSERYFPGTKKTATASQIRAVASTTFSSATEFKFTFRTPLFIPENTEVAIIAYTNAQAGQYKIWAGTIGEHISGSTTTLVTQQLNSGVFFQSSNGTSWSNDQLTDISFKVYRAVFEATGNYAHLEVDNPPVKKLTENTFTTNPTDYPANPILFTASSDKAKILHPAHGFIVGDTVVLSCDSSGFNNATSINGVTGADILGARTIDFADPYGYTITMDAAATKTLRGGGVGLMATEQYVADYIMIEIPSSTPRHTSMWLTGDLTTHQSFAGTQTPYNVETNISLDLYNPISFNAPYVFASKNQEDDPARLNGVPTAIIKVGLNTKNKYVAPHFNISAANIKVVSNFIDYQDSDLSSVSNRNKMSTIDYIAETEPSGGTNASKHITIPFTLEETATSIKVLVDAIRQINTDFTVWYRTSQSSASTLIEDINWTAFSKTSIPPNKSNYTDIGVTIQFREYEFNVFDISDFDQYQIKITMNSMSSSLTPMFKNLRTIATV